MSGLPELWKHQKAAIEFARPKNFFAAFHDPGTGKTRTLIEITREVFNSHSRIMRTVVFAPPVVCPNWRDEWRKYTQIKPDQVTVLAGDGELRLKTFLNKAYTFPELKEGPKGHVFVTNYEVLTRMPKLQIELERWRPEVVFFDESHKIKNPQAKVSEAAVKLANKAAYKYIATGTPILNNALDLFMQVKALMGGFPTMDYFKSGGDARFLITNFFGFRARFFADRNKGMPANKYFPDYQLMTLQRDGIDAAGELTRILSMIGTVAKKEECLDLPPELVQTIRVPMAPDQEKAYREMERTFIASFNEGISMAQLAITKGMRLQQITSGFVPLTDNDPEDEMAAAKVSFGKTPKQEALRELLETLTPRSKVLVWAVWKENYEQIKRVCEDLRIEYVEVHGGISSGKKKEENIQRFKTDDRVRVYIGHPGSGGIGVNLVQAGYSIRYSRTFSLEQLIQSRARNYRGGTKEQGHESITHYELVCADTIEELAVEALNGKQEISAKIIGALANELVLRRKRATTE